MNTEERHRLKTNELGQAVQVVGHRLEEHATKIVIAICSVLVLAAAITWWSRQTSSASVSAWSLLETAQTINDYGMVADQYKNTLAGRWAKLRESEMNLQTGMSNTFSNRELALSDLKHAKEGFEQLLAEKSLDPIMRERALWGLAVAMETTSDGDTSKAVEAYKQLLNDVPDTIYKPLAEQRVTELKTGGSKEFYAWFSKQNPKPTESRPKDGVIKNDADSLPPAANEFSPNPPNSGEPLPGQAAKPSDGATSEKPKTESPAKSEAKPEDGPVPAKDDEAKPGEKSAPEASTTPSKPDAPDSKDPGNKN